MTDTTRNAVKEAAACIKFLESSKKLTRADRIELIYLIKCLSSGLVGEFQRAERTEKARLRTLYSQD